MNLGKDQTVKDKRFNETWKLKLLYSPKRGDLKLAF